MSQSPEFIELLREILQKWKT